MAQVSIIGGGSWGIALAVLLRKNGHEITVWSALEREIAMLREFREHKMLPGVKLPEEIVFTTDDREAVEGKDLLVMAVASSYTRETAHRLSSLVAPRQKILNVAKGIEEHTVMTLSEIIEQEIPQADVAVMSGPSHAEEVGRGIPTTIVVGAGTKATAEYIRSLFMNEVFRVYITPDILGMELGGALKNVVALAAGIADGLGYGDNTKAALITRGITEIARLGTAMGGKFETFCGLTGIGDLIVTCASMHSRNRRAGILIGQGKTCEEAMEEVRMVVEGVYSAKAAMELARKYNVQMPIIEQVNAVLFEGRSAAQAVKELMLRDKKLEVSDLPWPEENR
ncbi:NAD(P)-dependent glycerol-3-phosphate dehydrogenase [Acetatifactor muris]|uniref:Glycerol-3-phosphate dehydrogenase [NAD(P)+] n=1 Tax=Acetatifactor muris TaxID=879566 RepID=A0A2K4ZDN7_9FIRM|nr:NAD(P)H-dependent glycerol-3-phosphate dehydrogenase [Acetatifactor muris]MCI8798774.1 NAD(P)-dependent glycerol-3-phosphate dehydrogenase [Lachnospiraceae bacterium]MCR2046838.1 NAD(P)-dependent glycerol-3-phosphate dehydrogenase [Acetatifactor muris]SOY28576.1 Glycerol-3-phosphate dehydrogenase [NAD(P)+] [Acetatifactor muris]